MKKYYHLLFYKLYRLFKSMSTDDWSDWKAYIVINTLEILLLIELMVWSTLIFKTIVNVPKHWVAAPVAIFIALFNYYTFLHLNRWKLYQEEFKAYSGKKLIITGWIVFLLIVGILGSLILSFYEMSLVDWRKYR